MAKPKTTRALLRRLSRRFDLETYLKDREPKSYGPNVAVDCPVCEKPGKLWILMDETKDGKSRGSFICYFCYDDTGMGVGGNALQLIQWLEDVSFVEALKVLTDGADREVSTDLMEVVTAAFAETEETTRVRLPEIDLPEEFIAVNRKRRPKYLRERGISLGKAMRYQLGYCKRGFFRNRLITPVRQDGRLVTYIARWMQREPPPGKAKTIYPKGCKTKQMLFNYDVARHKRRIVLVEDHFSAMAVGPSAVGTFGKTLSDVQLEMLLNSNAEELILCWDPDALEDTYRLVHRLSEFWTLRVVEHPDDRDIDEREPEERKRLLRSAPVVGGHDAFAAVVRRQLSGI